MTSVRCRVGAISLALLVAACTDAGPRPEAARSSTTGPPAIDVAEPVQDGKGPANAAAQDLAGRGYTEAEFFFGGTATAYVGAHLPGGVWDATEGELAEFRSRMIVRRPDDPSRFSGTVIVEWLNVTLGRDGDPSWGYTAEEIMREGHAWIGVSAQMAGVTALAATDPRRYGSLDHPGDTYSHGIFSQAGHAITRHRGSAPLGALQPRRLIATGLSQSAAFLIAYIDGVQPLVDVFDGFLVHSPAQPAAIRTDLDVPVLVFVTETDLTKFGHAAVRQPDSGAVRTWEVAGAAHVDAWLLERSGSDDVPSCPGRLNEGPHRHVARAALHHLVAWVVAGDAPPASPRIELAGERGPGSPPLIARDEHGNALGGIRTPLVDVPVASLSGEPTPTSPPLCSSFGTTAPLDAATLARLYPDQSVYLEAFAASTKAAVDAGFVLPPEAEEMMAEAEQRIFPTSVHESVRIPNETVHRR